MWHLEILGDIPGMYIQRSIIQLSKRRKPCHRPLPGMNLEDILLSEIIQAQKNK
jgi:hypothetical protein